MLHKSIFHLVFFLHSSHRATLSLRTPLKWAEKSNRKCRNSTQTFENSNNFFFVCSSYAKMQYVENENGFWVMMALFFAVQMWHLAHCAIALLPSFAIVSVHNFQSASIHCAGKKSSLKSLETKYPIVNSALFFVRKTLKNCTNLYLINHKILITTFAPPFFPVFLQLSTLTLR